ncbi:MAG TPA: isocitrate/isopropylmalate dehydrogenase family protein [Chloroflexota bacterium]
MAYNVTLIPGDGTGPEIMEATRRAIEATGVEFNWDVQDAGVDVMDRFGTPLPDQVIESIRRNKVAIKGPITTPVGTGFRSVNVALRKALDLYVNLRPCKTYVGVRSRYEDIDLVIVRENTEDLYAGVEFDVNTPETAELLDELRRLGGYELRRDSALAIKAISIFGSQRVVKYAFDYARQNKRKKVSAVHKANIMKYADGLFLHVAEKVAQDYPDIEFNNIIVDNMCMQLVQKPDLYDVLVMPNLYGDILSDLCAGLVGGLGVAPGANIGEGIAVFEPIHGSAPRYAGQNKVNPTAAMLSGVMMLRYLNEMDAAERLETALASVIAEGKDVTYDLKPTRDDPSAVGTAEFGDAVIRRLRASRAPAAA